MMQEIVRSVGIDIGTSTTQLVFSRLVVENLAGNYAVPRISIVEKEVIYRSKIYFTPLRSPTEIDTEKVKEIVRGEYAAAGIRPEDLQTGAVIITGDTARKQNANQVLEALSDMAGDFVVATAGPDLESVLSARGAGADVISEEHRTTVANIDIGGGTSNIALYEKGTLRGVSCLDIGGRLIKVEQGRISWIFPKIHALAQKHGIALEVGDPAKEQTLYELCAIMAGHLAQALGLLPKDGDHVGLYTNDGSPIPTEPAVRGVTFSGGVADCVYDPEPGDVFRYGDIGVLLGRAIRNHAAFQTVDLFRAAETIRATVVGAGRGIAGYRAPETRPSLLRFPSAPGSPSESPAPYRDTPLCAAPADFCPSRCTAPSAFPGCAAASSRHFGWRTGSGGIQPSPDCGGRE